MWGSWDPIDLLQCSQTCWEIKAVKGTTLRDPKHRKTSKINNSLSPHHTQQGSHSRRRIRGSLKCVSVLEWELFRFFITFLYRIASIEVPSLFFIEGLHVVGTEPDENEFWKSFNNDKIWLTIEKNRLSQDFLLENGRKLNSFIT